MTLSEFVRSLTPGVPWCSTAVSREAVDAAQPVLVRSLAARLGLREDDVDVHVVEPDPQDRDSFERNATHLVVVARPGTWQGVSTALLDRLFALLPVKTDLHPNGSVLLGLPSEGGVQPTVRCAPVHVDVAHPAANAEMLWPEYLREFAAALRAALGKQDRP